MKTQSALRGADPSLTGSIAKRIMAVYEQSYSPWSGAYGSRLGRLWAMVWLSLVQPFKNIWVLLVIILAFMIVGGWLLLLFFAASQQALPPFVIGNRIYREGFYNFFLFSMILMVLSATVGASLISRDLRYNALLMYFSRSITRLDYVAAKFLTLTLLLLFVTLVPGLLLFLGQLGMGTERLTTGQRLADLGGIALHSLILVLPMSAVVLACSSLTKRAYLAAILWTILFGGSWTASGILGNFLKEDWCAMLSWMNLTAHLGNYCYPARQHTDPVLACGWIEPLIILGSATAVSLAVVWRRTGSVEAGE